MASLTGASIASSYTSLLKLSGNTDSLVAGNGSNAIQVVDGDGTASPLYLNTDRIGIGGQPTSDVHIFKDEVRVAGDTTALVLQDTSSFLAGTGPSMYFQGNQTGGSLQTFAQITGVSSSGVNEGTLIFKTRTGGSTSEKMSINTDGVLTLAFGQIKFPDTQNASSDAQVLDEYEEGTFTPTINEAGGSLTATGFYTKIGNCVNFSISMQSIGSTGSSSTALAGLPFTSSSTSGRSGGAFLVQTEKIDYNGVGHLNFGLSTGVTQFSMNFAADDGTRIVCTNDAFNASDCGFQIVGTYFT
tara:strand:+ start:2499 stop:3398 length:900 start_codon:yes stop_codon:yes gene_type:complete